MKRRQMHWGQGGVGVDSKWGFSGAQIHPHKGCFLEKEAEEAHKGALGFRLQTKGLSVAHSPKEPKGMGEGAWVSWAGERNPGSLCRG